MRSIRDLVAIAALPLLVALGAGCEFQGELPAGTILSCTSAAECPAAGSQCLRGQCVPVDVELPIVDALSLDTLEDTEVAVTLAASGVDATEARFHILDAPGRGTLRCRDGVLVCATCEAPPASCVVDETLTYAPAPDVSGQDSFRVAVENVTIPAANGAGLMSDPGVVTIDVAEVNDAPGLKPGATVLLEVDEDDANLLPILDAVVDADGDLLSVTVVEPPAHGSVEAAAAGVLLYRAEDPDYHGSDALQVLIDDGDLSLTVDVPVVVRPVNDPPQATAAAVQLVEGDAIDLEILGTDVDGDDLTLVITEGPSSGVLDLAVGDRVPLIDGRALLRYEAPDVFAGGTITFTAVVSDLVADSEPLVVDIRVLRSLRAFSATVDVQEDAFRDITLTGQAEGVVPTFRVTTPPSHGTVEVLGADLVRYAPEPDWDGPDSFGFRASAAGVESAEALVTVNVQGVNDAPAADSASLIVEQGQPLSITLTGSDVEPGALTARVVTAPLAGTLTGVEATGAPFALPAGGATAVYTPSPTFSGATQLTWVAVDAAGGTSPPATISITVTKALRANPISAAVDEDGEVLLTFSGQAEGVVPTFLVVREPSRGTLEPTGADSVVYRPTTNLSGTDSFTYIAAAAGAESAEATVTLDVRAVNDLPTAAAGAFEVIQGQAVAIVLQGDDVEDAARLRARVLRAPASGTLDVADGELIDLVDGSAAITFTADADFAGDLDLTYEIIDAEGGASAPAVASIHVARALRAFSGSARVDEDGTVEIELTGQAEGFTPAFVVTEPPSHGTLEVLSSNTVRYRPEPNFFGADALRFVAAAPGEESAPARIDITVSSVNDLPSAFDDVLFVEQGDEVALTLGGSDLEDVDLTALIVAAPGENVGSLSVAVGEEIDMPGGQVTLGFTASEGFLGEGTLTFLVRDSAGGESGFATFVITVLPKLLAFSPDDVVELSEDQSAVITLDGQGTGDLSFVITTAPLHGEILVIDASNVRYVPDDDYNGPDTFGFEARSSGGSSPEAFVDINVLPVNDAPAFKGATLVTDEETLLNIALSCGDVDGDPVTVSKDTTRQAARGVVTIPNNTLATYAPSVNLFGADTFDLLCSDGRTSASARFDISVRNVQDAPVATAPATVVVTEDRSAIVVLNGTDPDGDPITFSVGTASKGVLSDLDAIRGVLLYTPNPNAVGTDSFTFTVNDGRATSAPAIVTLNITPVNDAPTITSTVLTHPQQLIEQTFPLTISDVDGDASFTLTLLGAPSRGTVTLLGGNQVRYRRANLTAFLDDTFTLRVRDGSGASTDVAMRVELTGRPSCALALNTGESLGNTVHVIDPGTPGGAGRFLAFCDQTTAGGGWTLALRADGRNPTFEFNQVRWTDSSTLNIESPGFPENSEAKLETYNSVELTELLVGIAPIVNNGLTVSGDRRFLVARLQGGTRSSLRVAMANQVNLVTGTNGAVPARARWLRLFGAGVTPVLQTNCNQQAIRHGSASSTQLRIGILGNNESDCVTPESYIGLGASLTGAAPHNSVIVGNRNLVSPASSAPAAGFVFVRSRDFTASLPSRASCTAHGTAGARITGSYLVNGVPTTCTFGPTFVCGDSFTDELEECDDGNNNNGDTCDNQCRIVVCGNGRAEGNEHCDDANSDNDDGCTTQCLLPSCGDGFFQPNTNFEQCDDGNFTSDDGCEGTCTLPFCGDGVRQPLSNGEECDDGGGDGDGCSSSCFLEPCTQITDIHVYCAARVDWRAARDICVNQGKNLVTISNAAEAKAVHEQVANVTRDRSSYWIGLNDLDEENRFVWSRGERGATLRFGSGEPNNVGEEDCVHERGDGLWNDAPCEGFLQPFVCEQPTCGNGVPDPFEDCDDGDLDDEDGCSRTCTLNGCGDGFFRPDQGEECDDGNIERDDGCTRMCSESCGDLILSGLEACDDGNVNNFDGCSSQCDGPGPFASCFPIGGPFNLCVSDSTFEQAVELCASGGARVFTGEDENLMNEVRAFAGGGGYWIGLTDRRTEGAFSWENGIPLTYDQFLSPPDNGGGFGTNEDCVEETGTGWNEVDCDTTRSVLCTDG